MKYCDDPFSANLIKGKLESEAIEACVLNENTNSILSYSAAITSLLPQVVVADEDFERACALLDDSLAVCICPECGSDDVEFSFSGRSAMHRFFIKFVMLPISLISLSPLNMVKRTYICHKCKHQF